MLAAIDFIIRDKGWDEGLTWIWCDYISIPQKCKGMQLLAINSLSVYASAAHAFAIAAPLVRHQNTGQTLDQCSYNRRTPIWGSNPRLA